MRLRVAQTHREAREPGPEHRHSNQDGFAARTGISTVLPLGHAALAYLTYVGYSAFKRRRLPHGPELFPLAVGCQFPDLIDKPLAYVGVLPYGRSLAHSVFAFLLIGGAVGWGALSLRLRWDGTRWRDRLRRSTPAAFAVGYASHLIGDAYEALLAGRFVDAGFLLYPLLPLPEDSTAGPAPWVRLYRIYSDMDAHPQVVLVAVAAVVLVAVRVRTHVSRDRSNPRNR